MLGDVREDNAKESGCVVFGQSAETLSWINISQRKLNEVVLTYRNGLLDKRARVPWLSARIRSVAKSALKLVVRFNFFITHYSDRDKRELLNSHYSCLYNFEFLLCTRFQISQNAYMSECF